jgi:riboflavin kinase / FMN adenylyltransferase
MRQIALDSPGRMSDSVVAVGTFDGVHEGHVAVLNRVRERAIARSVPSVAITFDPHPLCVIAPERAPHVLTSLAEKAWRVSRLDVDVLGVVHFTPEVRELDPATFVERYLVDMLGVQEIVVGYDHGFGKDRSGDLDTIQRLGTRFGFDVVREPPTIQEGGPVSSTRIRSCVTAGDFEGARRLLGGGYPVSGCVVSGDGRGRQLGFPTANVVSDEPGKLMPPEGVYAAWAFVPQRHLAVVNLGNRPTFDGQSVSLEAHLIDFDGDLYDRTVIIEFERRIRGERRFEGPQALVDQIQRDCSDARTFLSKQESTLLRR